MGPKLFLVFSGLLTFMSLLNVAVIKGLKTPESLEALVLSSSSIKVSWRLPKNLSPKSTLFDLRWKVDGAKKDNSKVVSGSTSNIQLDNLKAYTMYVFRLRIGTVSGTWSNFTTYIYGMTGEGVPTAPPANVTAFNTSAFTIWVYWSQVPHDHRNGDIKGYKVCYEEANVTGALNLCYPVMALGMELLGLRMYQPYWITVSAYTRMGDGPASRPLLVSTDEFVPSKAPTIVSLVAKTTSFFVKWSPIPKGFVNGILRGYYILYYKTPRTNNNDKVVRVAADIKGVEIVGLERNATYGLRLSGLTRVRGVIRNGMVSPTRNVTTKYGAAAPANVRGYSPCSTCLQVTWDPVTGSRAPSAITGYRVLYLKAGADHTDTMTREVRVSKRRTSIKGLEKYSAYTVRVVAVTVDGLGVSSRLVKLITRQDVPSRAPGRVVLHTTSAHSVRVEWGPVPPKYTHGIVLGYKVMYENKLSRVRRSTTHAGVISTVTVNATSLNTEIRGLKPYTAYLVWVLAFTVAGNGPRSSKVEIRTDEDVPSQAPRNFKVVGVNPNSIEVQWSPVPPQYIQGVLSGYRVQYKRKSSFLSNNGKSLTVNSSVTAVQIRILEANTKYVLTVAALTRKGPGPYSGEVQAQTIKNEPGRPIGLHVRTTSSRSVQVSWQKPTIVKGRVTRFMLKWSVSKTASDNSALLVQEGHKILMADRKRQVGVSGLTPYKKYTFTVREETDNSVWGPFSQPIDVRMPEDAPSVPLGLSVIEKVGTSLEIGWTKPEHPNGAIRKYVVVLSRLDGIWRSFIVEPPKEDTESLRFQFIIPDETAEYKITVQAFTAFPGRVTEELTIQHLSSDHLTEVTDAKDPYLSKLPWLLCGLAVIILLLIITLVIVLIRRAARKSSALKAAQIPLTNFHDRNSHPVAVADLVEHCRVGHANSNILFSEEFKSLAMLEPGKTTCEASLASYNKHKNRFPNILAYDKTRVLLKHCRGTQGSDYINASYISGYSFPARYIATQSPLRETIADFWRMLWEQECRTIVMLDDAQSTHERPSCEHYWPENGPLEYGMLAVSPVSTTTLSDFIMRKFIVWSTDPDCMDKREVIQIQYTSWPDQRVPPSTASFLLFHHKFKTLLPLNPGPIVVHCSSGIGRTGTFIAINAMLDQMETEGVVDVFSFVSLIRSQRHHMVQNEEQYRFIYDVLRDASVCGRTEMTSQELGGRLLAPNPRDTETNVKRACEFENLQDDVPGYPICGTATNTDNVVKNRCPDVLPYEHNRVRLSVLPDVSGSDYINASYVDGYNDGKIYIATQGPLKNTTNDFWRMVWEQRCNTIVMLTDLDDDELEQCIQYWPNIGSARYGKIWVTKINEEELPNHTERVFKVKYHGNPDALLLYHFQYRSWPEEGNPPSTTGLVYVNDQVQKIQRPSGPSGPVIVHCSDGVGRTGVFLTLALSIERLETEETIDIFQTVRCLRAQRPSMVRNTDQYSTCYQAMKAYLSWRAGASRNVYV